MLLSSVSKCSIARLLRGFADSEERLAQCVVAPVVRSASETESLARNVTFGKFGLLAVIESYMTGTRSSPTKSSLIDRFAERVVFDSKIISHFSSRKTATESLLSLKDELVRDDGRAASLARLIKCGDPFLAVLRYIAFNTLSGNAEDANNV